MTHKRTLLVIGGGVETEEYIKVLKKKYCFILIDKDENCPSRYLCDHFIKISIYKPYEILENILKKDYRKHICGVMCLGSDAPLTVAVLSQELRLKSIPISAAKIASNKVYMKKLFKKLNINTPKYVSSKYFQKIKDFTNKNGFPIILKPDDSRGARGVSLLWNRDNLEREFFNTQNFSKSNTVIAEEFINGHQISSESIIYNKIAYNIGFSDRNYELINKNSFFVIENGGDLPASLSSNSKKKIGICIQSLADELKISNGIIKGDIIILKNKIYFIEIALRLSGGYFCSHKIPYNTGVNFLELATKIATNQKISLNELKIKYNKPVSQRFLIPKNGKIQNFNQSYFKENKNIILSKFNIKKGLLTNFPKDHSQRLGCVIATGKTKNDAIHNAKSYINNINLKYKA